MDLIMKKLTKIALALGLVMLGASMNAQAASCINSDTSSPTTTDDVIITNIGSATINPGISSDYCSFVKGSTGGNAANDTANDMEPIFGITDTLNVIEWNVVTSTDISFNGNTSGQWTYSGSTDLSSPFVVVLKSSISYAAYLFNNLTGVKGGSFVINFLNASGKKAGAISHLNIYKATGTFTNTILGGPNPVPLPAALWLFAPALLGFMGFRRKANV